MAKDEKSKHDKPLSFASVGKGSAHHFCMELLKSEAGIPLLHVYVFVAWALLIALMALVIERPPD